MNILLLGEFSGLHHTLKEGLTSLGHEVTIAASGDGWKKIPCDIDLSVYGNNVFSKFKRRCKFFKFILTLRNYDVVQIINADFLSMKFFPNKWAVKYLKRNNKKIFLLGAGDDAYFWEYGREKLKYGPFEDTLKLDYKATTTIYCTKRQFDLNKFIAKNVSGIIPIMFEYAVSYENCSNVLPPIPIPINIDKVNYKENKVDNKFVVFHGLNRPGFKGTHHIEAAFQVLKQKYSDVEFIIKGKMPLNEYLELMARTNLVIDQTNSHSHGVNGLLAMAMGKVVLGGVEKESLDIFSIDSSPAINIKPNSDDIIDKVSKVIEMSPEKIKELGEASRLFIEKNHNYKTIAQKYLNAWEN